MIRRYFLIATGLAGLTYFVVQGCGSYAGDSCTETRTPCGTDSGPNSDAPSDVPVYVSPRGEDSSSAGPKERPFKTIGAALAKSRRVSVCEGEYPEQVNVTSEVEMTGGFDCDSWAAGSKPTTVRPTSGIPLTIRANNVSLSRLTFIAAPGTPQAPSTIAAFVSESQRVTMREVTLIAAVGARGIDGTLSRVTNPTTGLDGNDADGGVGGGTKTCTCPAGGSSTGGAGGGPNLPGDPGSATPSTGRDGGGGGAPAMCSSAIQDGSSAPAGSSGTSAPVPGVLSTSGWVATAGTDGQPGGPGQGGGGGGGPSSGLGSGGGGACGACGGAGGGGGTGGGGSIALLSFSSDVTLAACTLSAAKGGDGGNGAAGQSVTEPGGFGGVQARGGCPGGKGGNGGNGGAGAGGAGGVSVGVLSQGTPPHLDPTTQSNIIVKEKGARGIGGGASDCTSATSNCGAEGTSAPTLDLGSL